MKDILYFNTLQDIKIIDMMRVSKKKEEHDYSKDYLTFEALESGTFTFTKAYYSMYGSTDYLTTEDFTNIGYSLDNGNTWTMLTNSGIAELQTITTPTVSMGEKVIWKGISQYHCISGVGNVNCAFSSTGEYKVSGNIMSILYGDNFSTSTILPQPYTSGTLGKYTLCRIFDGNTKLISAENLILPTTLTRNCYYGMFQGCTSLIKAPKLPATILANYCYSGMFQNCTALTTAPELPATTLSVNCYSSMFLGCTSLTAAPVLPATTMATGCYSNMFQGCTSLTISPELNATTLAERCYNSMFQNCTALTTTSELPATTLADSCYSTMFQGCTSLTTAPTLNATTLANSCYSSMFSGCTSLTTAPTLPATTLVSSCYNNMFYGCSALTTAPELPATTLVISCYQYMFQNCKSLRYIKMMATNISATNCLLNWVSGVASSGTFVKNSSASWTTTGTSGIPTGWTVETADS